MIINIVTPCSRPENLMRMAESINIPSRNYRWIVVHDARNFPLIETPRIAEQHLWQEQGSTAGHAQRNFANKLITEGYVLQLDDDTILHPNFWESVKDCEEDIVGWKQSWADGSHRLYAGKYSIGSIDSGSFMVKRSIIGDLQWQKEKYDADGYFAEQIITKAKTKKEIDKYLSYYNYLRK